MNALALAGTSDQVQNLLAVLTEGSRSDEARIAAGNAIAGILGRHNVDGDAIDAAAQRVRVRRLPGRAPGRGPCPGPLPAVRRGARRAAAPRAPDGRRFLIGSTNSPE
ncbi:MAG: hypothetical protein R3E96_00355 [Planctomycetota bacterium]